MNRFRPENFFDLEGSDAAGLFQGLEYVWEGVVALPAYIEKILAPEILGEVEEGAWLEPGRVRLGAGSRVERGAVIRGPAIIGRNTVVRSGAYFRGHVMVGDDCVVGWGTELRQVLMLNGSESFPTRTSFSPPWSATGCRWAAPPIPPIFSWAAKRW